MDSKRIDIGVGIAMCILSVIIYSYSEQYVGRGVNKYGPNFFPQALSILMFICSLLMIVQALRGHAMKNLEPINRVGFLRTSVTLGISLVYLVVMQYLGFFLSTILFLFVVMTYLKQKNIWIRVITCVLVTITIFGIFHYFLKIPLPEGIFYNG